jgi:hypothetical protein
MFSQWAECNKHGPFMKMEYNTITFEECPFCATRDINDALNRENDCLIEEVEKLKPRPKPPLKVINFRAKGR